MEGEEVRPFVVRALSDHKAKDKTLLSFKKDQKITVERVDNDRYFGFYGKSEGWFDKFYVLNVDGAAPEVRKTKATKKPAARAEKAPQNPGESKPDKANSGRVTKKELRAQKKKEKEDNLRAKKEAKKVKKPKKGKGKGKGAGAPPGPSRMLSAGAFPTDDGKQIPAIVESTISYLEQPEHLKLEGLFRVSGSLNDVNHIKSEFLKGKKVDLSQIADPHTVAGVLKIFFRESKDPLLTFELYDCWIEAISNPLVDRVAKIRQVVQLLPTTNRLILKRLMGLLAKVAAQSSVNLMTVQNIAIVFAPTLLRPKDNQLHIVIQDSTHANELIKLMIERHQDIFVKEDPMDSLVGAGASAAAGLAKGPLARVAGETDEQFGKRMKRGSLLLARGSIIGGHNTFQELARMEPGDDEDGDVNVDVSFNDIDGSSSGAASTDDTDESESESLSNTGGSDDEEEEPDEEPGSSSSGALSISEMMDKILEGQVNEVDAYLATLEPSVAAATKKDLLERIDKLMQSEEFNC